MATEAVKSASVTNLDATPYVPNATGVGAGGYGVVIDDHAAFADALTLGSTYRVLRLPSNAILKRLEIWLDAAVTTFTADIDVYYSDSTVDGTSPTNQGLVAADKFFGTAIVLAAQATRKDLVPGLMTTVKMRQPLWKAIGLTADPGGYLDILLKTTATTSGAGVVQLQAVYVPYSGGL